MQVSRAILGYNKICLNKAQCVCYVTRILSSFLACLAHLAIVGTMVAVTTSTRQHWTSGPFAHSLVTPSSSSAVLGPPRQSSLRSITSTHSRRSLKCESATPVEQNQPPPRRRVRFACTDELDLSGRDESHNDDVGVINADVVEFETVAPLQVLSLTSVEIVQIRLQARRQAAQFAADHADYIDLLNECFEQGTSFASEPSSQLEPLRRRRLRRNTFQVCNKWLELESDVVDNDDQNDFNFEDEEEEEPIAISSMYCDDDVQNADYYCTMRGLETRLTPALRLRRRWAIQSVLQLQREMKDAHCDSMQMELGLRATAVQVSKKAHAFARFQALLDEMEVYGTSS
jgi:hypothetical protein